MVRRALVKDVKQIHELLNGYAIQGLLLPRSLTELYGQLRDYFVSVREHDQERIRGVCALGICWEDLAEIKSLAVWERDQGHGYATELVGACLNEARSLGLRQVFTLTYLPGFFEKFGFRRTEKSKLPHKIWADCLKCAKFPNCEETALKIDL